MAQWLRLVTQSTPPHCGYLEECQAPYRALDRLADETPAIVQLIGSGQKYKLIDHLFRNGPPTQQSDIIHIVEMQDRKQSIILFDCPTVLHPSKMDMTMDDKAGYLHRHPLKGWKLNQSNFQTTVQLNSQLLAGISQTVVVFVDDFPGSSSIIELLVAWARNCQRDLRSRPRLLLVSEEYTEKVDMQARFLDRLFRYFVRLQQMSDPTRPYVPSDVETMFWNCFESLHLISDCSGLLDRIMLHTQEMLQRRTTLGWAFSGSNLCYLLRQWISRFARNEIGAFDFVLAFRTQDPAAKRFEHHIEVLLHLTPKPQLAKMAKVVASALYMDAYPKGGHCPSDEHILSYVAPRVTPGSSTSMDGEKKPNIMLCLLVVLPKQGAAMRPLALR
ncbi:hypothetical protein PG999_005450 [Apiospora kogelbergensis]|uniref:Uncharacterized protein n=1 Tax=Apiospora kogelbergensis TaxID=1337665 RepID=A0AAW0R238_9PEZI